MVMLGSNTRTRPAKGKRRARRGQGHVPRISQPHTNSLLLEDRFNSEFTLAEEAQHTSEHDHSSWTQDSQLRKNPVSFVSVGANANASPESKLRTESLLKSSPVNHQTVTRQPRSNGDREHSKLTTATSLYVIPRFNIREARERHNNEQFSPQMKPNQPGKVHTPEENEITEQASNDSSSEEIIVFKGRKCAKDECSQDGINLSMMQTELDEVEKLVLTHSEHRANQYSAKSPKCKPQTETKSHQRRWPSHTSTSRDEEAIISDYIANMRENGELSDIFFNSHPKQYRLDSLERVTDKSSSPTQEQTLVNGVSIEPVLPAVHSTSTCPEHKVALRLADPNHTLSEGGLVAPCHGSHSQMTRKQPITGPEMALEKNDADDSDPSVDSVHSKRSDLLDLQAEFDFMDWERPSLHSRKGKGSKTHLETQSHDLEITQRLEAAWKNDRLKKSQRKREREEQRLQGMLGKKTGSGDLRPKYLTGINLQQVAEEVKLFLCDTRESISLPPMDKHARRVVHELVTKFNIKSKSVGSGNQRRPTLNRTKATLQYVESDFDSAVKRVQRKFFPRLDSKTSWQKQRMASYRDGEVVGASAPELGSENRGRAMLEKMGWSLGSALGAVDNKGILQPVPQTMKKSKAGLG